MKLFLLLFIIGCVNLAHAQKRESAPLVIVESFCKEFNDNEFEEIFNLFSSETTASPAKLKQTLETLKKSLGKIDTFKFVKLGSDSSALFKVTFDYAVMGISFSLDNENKIKGLKIKPFKSFQNQVQSQDVINNLATNNTFLSDNQLQYMYEYAKNFPNNSQLAFAIINDGKVEYYGLTKINDTISYCNNQKNIFEVGSITKVFTSTVLAEMVLRNKVELDDNIFEHLQLNNENEIKLLSLSNHTSGLPRLPSNLDLSKANPKNPYKNYGSKQLIEYLQEHLSLQTKNIQEYQYSNLGAGLLGFTLSKVNESTFEDLLNKEVFTKYNMTHSTTDKRKTKNLVKGLDRDGKITENWDMASMSGAGAVLSNVGDLSKFVLAHFENNNKALEMTRRRTFHINEKMDIGMGWHLRKSQNNAEWAWHNGGTGGYTSSITFNPLTKNGIIILSNVSAFHPDMSNIDKLNFTLMETLEQ